MNPAHSPGLPTAIEAAVQRVKMAARSAAERCLDGLGTAALATSNATQRDHLLNAQFELNRKLGLFGMAFDEAMDHRIEREVLQRGSPQADTQWDALSLVGDEEMDAKLLAERFGVQIAQACESEQRELDTFFATLLATGDGEPARNPLRPENIGTAMVRSLDRITERSELRAVLRTELERTLAASLGSTYAGIVADLKAAGIKPTSMGVRTSPSARSTSGADSTHRAAGLDDSQQGTGTGMGDLGAVSALGRADFASTSQRQALSSGTLIGQVDAGLMTLIRRLAFTDAGHSGFDQAAASGMQRHDGRSRPVAPNLIRANRDALREATTGSLDHMVIDVIGSLFDQILSDPKVPPQMARHIARLQLPVLRAALGDSSFFSSRKHPVRRFVNRIASLGVGFEDFESEQGRKFIELVGELVQQIVSGDFDQIEVYEQKLSVLENFVVEQAKRELEAGATALLAERETDLRLQQRYMQQLQALLKPLPAPDFVRDFLSQVWSQALMRAAKLDAGESPRVQRLRHAGRELFMSVQPKGSPVQRKTFLQQLPTLMKELTEGMELIGWPESAKKAFFGQLLPAHAESLKGEALRTLDYNLLAKQIDSVFDEAMPSIGELPPPQGRTPVLRDEAIVPRFSAEEAKRIGLIDEGHVNWNGKVDIDLSAEPEPADGDLDIAGLPKAEAAEPSSGKSLADHVQIGFAYRMHLNDKWHKVRLSHVSPGRSFFVFTLGARHKQTISMTRRMLVRLCETGRLRAFESGYLLERATMRARRQLAAIGSGSSHAAH